LFFLEYNVLINIVFFIIKVHKSSIYRFQRIAIQRSYNSAKSRQIFLFYVVDVSKSGRPTVCTQEVVEKVIANICKSVKSRYSITATIGYSVEIGVTSV
jgi:hypothetical protein